MIRGGLLLLALALVGALAATAQAQQPLDDACDQVSPTAATCTGADKLAEAAAAECRLIGVPEESCALPLGHQVSSQIVRDYADSWLHRTAVFQYELGDGEPLLRAQWLGTHNSFNSFSESPTLSHGDSNQQLTLTQQLDIDVRALELDLHFVPSLATAGASTVVVCHGRGPDEAHFGCTNEPGLAEVLAEIRAWLDAHPGQVLLLYLEDELGAEAGYEETIATLDEGFARPDGSSLLYRPSPSEMTDRGCADLPLGVSRDDVRAGGAQVVLVGNCRSGWGSHVYGWDENHVESGSTPDYKPFPECDATYGREVYDSKLVRYYEDSTFVSAAVDPTESPADAEADSLTPDKVQAMTRCGVNLFGFDQLLPHDGRIKASIWSWAWSEPDSDGGRCGLQRTDGRWVTRPCGARRFAACRTTDGWRLSLRAVPFAAAPAACRARQGQFSLPRTGYENSLLRRAAGDRGVWLSFRLG